MRYIINENRLNKVIQSYLDQMDWWEWDIGDGEFNLADGKYESNKILFRIQYSSTMPDHYYDVIYLSDSLVTKISKLFSIPKWGSIEAIIEWFNKRYDKSLTMKNFQWMDEEEQDED